MRVRLEVQLGPGTRPFEPASETGSRERALRSDVKTKGDLGSCLRWNRRSARSLRIPVTAELVPKDRVRARSARFDCACSCADLWSTCSQRLASPC